MTKHLSAIHNAWHFWFASNFVIKAQCGSRCVLRCSRLNAALCEYLIYQKIIFQDASAVVYLCV
ncbi:DUF3265 domain-containing protein [Vibrio parahaemolyticus]|nr:DUF3265 domain-containing protein [Vibrio parahaemolyticus]